MAMYHEVLAKAQAYIEKPGNEVGGSLHIVLEDANLEPGHIGWCVGWAVELGDEDGRQLAIDILWLTEVERWRLIDELEWP